jgi:mannose-6-phosphate isomerase-like protein (cupin superfamily)
MKTDLIDKFNKISGFWRPYIIGELNDNHVKLAKLKGDFVWHNHQEEDEMFVVISGTLMMDFRDRETVITRPGEILIIPKGVEHFPWTKDGEEVHVMLIEPKSTKHTGEVITSQTVEKLDWI